MVPEIMTGQRSLRSMKDLFDGVDRRLGVQCIKDRLDHQDISAAIEQPAVATS